MNVEETKVYRTTNKLWLFALLCAYLLLLYGIHRLYDPEPTHRFFALETIGLAGMGIVLSLVILPTHSFLRTDRDGLTIRVFWRTTFYRWEDIECFGLAIPDIPDDECTSPFDDGYGSSPSESIVPPVGFNLTKAGLDKRKSQRRLRDYPLKHEFSEILPETYGWHAAELAQHLNFLHDRYAAPIGAKE